MNAAQSAASDIPTFDNLTNGEESIELREPMQLAPEIQAEVDTQITTAKRFPRNLHRFKQEALAMATFDEEIAEGCFYALRRSGKPIEGPSIRLAEIILSAWGNIRADAKVVAVGDKDLTAEAMTWDLEKNVAIRVQVKRRITDKSGRRYNDDMIVTTGNAACAIALRNSAFKVIPMVYTKAIYQQARLVAIGDVKTLAAKRSAMIDHFGKMGVSEAEVFAAVDKAHLEEVGLDELAILKGYATAIKEGDTSVDEIFRPGNGHATELKEKTKANQDTLREKLQPTAEQSAPEGTAEQKADDEAELRLFDLRKNAVERLNELQKDDKARHADAEKWLGKQKLTELDEAMINEFLKEFGS